MAAGEERTRAGQAKRVLTWAFAIELIALALTGLWLSRWYRPTAAQSWAEIYGGVARTTWSMRIRDLHRWVAYVTVFPTSIALAALVIADVVERSARRGARALRIVGAIAVPLLTVAVALTGTLLPWDQLGLRAVTVGTDMSGYQPLFGDQVRFVLVGGAEVATTTVRTALIIHAAVLPLLLIAALAATALLRTPSASTR